jgi:deoxyribonuclease IV
MALLLGSHVSMSKGLLGAAIEAHSYGSDTFMIYTGAPQNTLRKPLEQLKIEEGRAFMKEHNLQGPVVHAPYIINLASNKESIYSLAQDFFKEEIRRAEAIGADYIVIHPGSFTETDVEFGINQITRALNSIIVPEQKITICLETMAGKGSEIGRNFEELQAIIQGVTHNSKLGICFDTCHTHDSGYPITTDFNSVLDSFDSILGLERIKVFHINGSLNPQGARKDRHANIGADTSNPKGPDFIGSQVIHSIIHHPICQNKPLILETPWLDGKTNLYKEEIAFLRKEHYE